VSGRHAGPDPVTIALGTAWAGASTVLLTLLAILAHEPCSCSPGTSASAPVSAPDLLPPGT
jgi:hypothetical protein